MASCRRTLGSSKFDQPCPADHALWAPERALRQQGIGQVAGVDEVGVGPLAGPVVAAAVVFNLHDAPAGLDDSKRLSPRRREELVVTIRARAVAVGLAGVAAGSIDQLGIRPAIGLAMRRALASMWHRGRRHQPVHALVDGYPVAGLGVPQTAMVAGDRLSASIAAASILAKVARDALMRALDAHYPAYGFAEHKGYGTARHLAALAAWGPCPAHRRSFAPVARSLGRAGSATARQRRGALRPAPSEPVNSPRRTASTLPEAGAPPAPPR